MARVIDVAKYILEKKGSMSTWKLQKLCYYSQAWTLAWDGKSLIDEEFQAWANGPVCPVLFHRHKGEYSVGASYFSDASSDNLTEEEKENIDIVLEHYGDKEAYWLREQTHSEAPWKEARQGIPEGAYCDRVITNAAMSNYYGAL